MTRSQLVLGTLFVALGVLLLLDRFDVVDAWSVVGGWWPLIVVAMGVAQLVARPRNVTSGVVLLVLGGALLSWTLGAVGSLALLWPALLIALGLWLLSGRIGTGVRTRGGGRIDVTTVLGDRTVRVPDGPFAGGALTTVLGDVHVDLRRAVLEDEATVQVTTVLGDVTLEVPTGWQVTVSGPELLGDVTLRPEVGSAPVTGTLRLRVLTLLGDLTVRGTPVAGADPA